VAKTGIGVRAWYRPQPFSPNLDEGVKNGRRMGGGVTPGSAASDISVSPVFGVLTTPSTDFGALLGDVGELLGSTRRE